MKRLLYFFGLVIVTSIVVDSCSLVEDDLDESLLYSGSGKWQSGTLYEVYKSNKTGHTWDEGDDVTEDEAQPFTWTLVKSNLTQIHIMEMGANIPKVYTVTELTATTLKYKSLTKTYTFSKVN